MKKCLFISLAAAMMTNNVFGGFNDVSHLQMYWTGTTAKSVEILRGNCAREHNAGDQMCIGETMLCKPAGYTSKRRGYSDEHALIVMAAVEVKETGAKFCPLEVDAANTDRRGSWTEYAFATSNGVGCVWLCRDGYTGGTCDKIVTDDYRPQTCDSAVLLKETNYDDVKLVEKGGTNAEYVIPMFEFAQQLHCAFENAYNEFDMLLLLEEWLESGNGAKVRLKHVGAVSTNKYKVIHSNVNIGNVPNAEPVLVCKNGYRSNEAKTDCVAIDQVVCSEIKICSGYDYDKYDEGKHTLVFDEASKCWNFRCRGQDMVFDKSDMQNFSCVAIDPDAVGGVSPSKGTWVSCKVGEFFDDKTETCKKAIGFTKSDMRYGKGKTKDSNVDVLMQCWTKTTIDEYKKCVFGEGTQFAPLRFKN